MDSIPHIGEISALVAAFLWAMASVIYRKVGVRIPPLTVNAVKGVLSVALLCITMVVLRTGIPGMEENVGWNQWLVLLGSGAIGIGLGDTAFFAALNRMGERRTVLAVETLAPPIAVVLGGIMLREFLSPMACGGILTTLAGVAWVMADRKGNQDGSAENEMDKPGVA